MRKINWKIVSFVFVACILFIIPFFWLSHGEIDIGGDSQRLYFYDPLSLLKNFSLYSVAPWGTGKIYYNQYFLIYLLLLTLLKSILGSPTLLIDLFNGLKLSLSFVFTFLIIKEFRQKKLSQMSIAEYCGGIIGALFYTMSPSVLDNLKFALITHDMVFVNPMVFYFLMRYLRTLSLKYIWFALITTFIFSSSFALFNPPLFAFYPLAAIFLFFYNHYVLQKKIPWRGLIFFVFFFVGLHAFHIFPELTSPFDKGSEYNTRTFETFSGKNVGQEYFDATHSFSKVSTYLLAPLEEKRIQWSLGIIPFLALLGFVVNRDKKEKVQRKIIVLVVVFFLSTLYLVSSNITNVGVNFYRLLFLIPGFGMFRNFSGVWQFTYAFFYAVLAGLLISAFFLRLKKKYIVFLFLCVVAVLVFRSQGIINGKVISVTARGSNGLNSITKIDPKYETMLQFIENIPNDGKVFHVPFTDFAYNLVAGTNEGVYIGQSMVGFLKGKNAYSGYQDIDPYSEALREATQKGDYARIRQILSLLQVRYILYDSDPRVSSIYFPTFPYGTSGVPASPSGTFKFVNNISKKPVYKSGFYSLFETDKDIYLPHVYPVSIVKVYDAQSKYNTQYFKALSFLSNDKTDFVNPRVGFITRDECLKFYAKQSCDKGQIAQEVNDVKISFQKINPTKYKIKIENIKKPFFLAFQSAFSSQWKLYFSDFSLNSNIIDSYFDGKVIEFAPSKNNFDRNMFETNNLKSISESSHIEMNGYANAWYIKPNTIGEYEMIAEMNGQKTFYYSLILSSITFLAFIAIGIKLILPKKYE